MREVRADSGSGCQIPWSGLTWVPGLELGSLQGSTCSELPSHFFRPSHFLFPFFFVINWVKVQLFDCVHTTFAKMEILAQ